MGKRALERQSHIEQQNNKDTTKAINKYEQQKKKRMA
jgi:hypothetical protein